jgi:hypothetical protein
MVAMLIGYTLVALSYLFRLNSQAAKIDWRAAAFIGPYFLGMLVISYFGDFGPGGIIGGIGIFKHVLDHGGNDDLGLVGGLIASAAWSLVVFRIAIACRLPEADVDRYVADVCPPPVD